MRSQTLCEGRWIFAILAALAVASWWLTPWLSLAFLILIIYTLAFFRDPDRIVPTDPTAVVAAADGTVTEISEIEEPEVLKAKTHRVGIFLSIFDASLIASIGADSASTRAAPIVRKRTKQ
ncbi:MAG: hypothetical protein DMF25_01530 [Verrucomicrobia bacterium]|nr:MAG: hypothetical protein DMF25_01530 [Verrucomicrobiota bacterium]